MKLFRLAFIALSFALPAQALADSAVQPSNAVEEVDPGQVKYTENALLEHFRQIADIYRKTPVTKPDLRKTYYQMMLDCSFIEHDLERHYIAYKIADKVEKKMADILKDGIITDREVSDWHKELRTVGISPAPTLGDNNSPTKPSYKASHR